MFLTLHKLLSEQNKMFNGLIKNKILLYNLVSVFKQYTKCQHKFSKNKSAYEIKCL